MLQAPVHNGSFVLVIVPCTTSGTNRRCLSVENGYKNTGNKKSQRITERRARKKSLAWIDSPMGMPARRYGASIRLTSYRHEQTQLRKWYRAPTNLHATFFFLPTIPFNWPPFNIIINASTSVNHKKKNRKNKTSFLLQLSKFEFNRKSWAIICRSYVAIKNDMFYI